MSPFKDESSFFCNGCTDVERAYLVGLIGTRNDTFFNEKMGHSRPLFFIFVFSTNS